MRTVLCELRCFRSIPSSLHTINLKHVQDTEDGRQSFSNLSMYAGIPCSYQFVGPFRVSIRRSAMSPLGFALGRMVKEAIGVKRQHA
jgi:hypothetical protein